jgi:hypothetical protein
MESKYRFRGGEKIFTDQPVPKEYWNLKNAGKMDEAKQLIGGDGYGIGKDNGKWFICEIGEKQEHDNPADFYNTCGKMAKKRALVDAVLTVTAASDIFTQDIEELVDNGVMTPKQEANEKTVKPPQKKAEPESSAVNTITAIVSDVRKTTGINEKTQKPWAKFIVKCGDVEYSTFSETYAKVAKDAKELGVEAIINFTTNKFGNEIKAIVASEPGDVA